MLEVIRKLKKSCLPRKKEPEPFEGIEWYRTEEKRMHRIRDLGEFEQVQAQTLYVTADGQQEWRKSWYLGSPIPANVVRKRPPPSVGQGI